MMTRDDAMAQAIKEAESFCNKYDVCPYGENFSDFRKITTINFFNKIYDDSLQATIEAQEIIIKDMTQHRTCEGCRYDTKYHNDMECQDCIRRDTDDYYFPKAQP